MDTAHSPLRKGDYTRSAGDSLMEMMLRCVFLFFIVVSALTYFIGYVVGALKYGGIVESSVLFSIALVLLLGVVLYTTYTNYAKYNGKLDNMVVGRHGERFVARILEELRPYGYTPVHDVVFTYNGGKRCNIDHVLVGPNGVFVVETKTKRKSGEYRICDTREIKDAIEQTHKEAEKLKNLLHERMGKRWNVIPILTYPRWLVEPSVTEQAIRESGVYVFSTQAMGAMLHRYFPTCTVSDKEIQSIVYSLRAYAEDKANEKLPRI